MKEKGGTSCSRQNRQDKCALGERHLGEVRQPGRWARRGDPALVCRDRVAR
ncbi:hypothetical protein HMPREF1979_01142 [Actinomyces johnsonii F0542]|uniref:Uncharacterized protein n=1 Tax=Actinomyces johnsonii F0542 TaxID=1321818 RepID=U1QA96_9ACTO|nr:hypothetical protein HMPREF1979_01142 [Actinomyces johnsonii F0542]